MGFRDNFRNFEKEKEDLKDSYQSKINEVRDEYRRELELKSNKIHSLNEDVETAKSHARSAKLEAEKELEGELIEKEKEILKILGKHADKLNELRDDNSRLKSTNADLLQSAKDAKYEATRDMTNRERKLEQEKSDFEIYCKNKEDTFTVTQKNFDASFHFSEHALKQKEEALNDKIADFDTNVRIHAKAMFADEMKPSYVEMNKLISGVAKKTEAPKLMMIEPHSNVRRCDK